MEILAVIPIRGNYLNIDRDPRIMLNKKPLISYTLDSVKKSRLINRTIVSTDSSAVAGLARESGVEAPFIRPGKFAKDYSSLGTVLRHALFYLEENQNYKPDVVILLEIGYPFRDEKIIDNAISTLSDSNLDTVFVGLKDNSNYWKRTEANELELLTAEIDVPREYKKSLYREIRGLAMATKVNFIKKGELRGERVGLIPLDDEIMSFRIISPMDLKLAELIAGNIGNLR